MVTKNEEAKRKGRRDFLKLATLSAPAAVAAAAGATAAEAKSGETTGSRMRDTEHTRAYFESAKF